MRACAVCYVWGWVATIPVQPTNLGMRIGFHGKHLDPYPLSEETLPLLWTLDSGGANSLSGVPIHTVRKCPNLIAMGIT